MGAVPLVVAGGPGSASRATIGVVVIFGVAFSTLLSLCVVPAFYALLAPFTRSPDAVARERERLEAETPSVAMPEAGAGRWDGVRLTGGGYVFAIEVDGEACGGIGARTGTGERRRGGRAAGGGVQARPAARSAGVRAVTAAARGGARERFLTAHAEGGAASACVHHRHDAPIGLLSPDHLGRTARDPSSADA